MTGSISQVGTRVVFLSALVIELVIHCVVVCAQENHVPTESLKKPVQVAAVYPGYFRSQEIDVSLVRVEFYAPVTGIKSHYLTVNGSAATRVSGEGEGLYTFSGYSLPDAGEVEIILKPGKDLSSITFHEKTWRFHLFSPAGDDDGDGLINAMEFNLYTDMTDADSDDDGIPDFYEASSPCLNPTLDEAHLMAYTGDVLPGDDDADGDGLTNLEEFKQGTDPCSA